jgi:hypothetical protein
MPLHHAGYLRSGGWQRLQVYQQPWLLLLLLLLLLLIRPHCCCCLCVYVPVQAWLADVESVPSAFTKLVLAGSTGGTAYAAVYSTCWMPLGSHSLLGWLWALLGWVWRILLWDTSYMLQVGVLKGGG